MLESMLKKIIIETFSHSYTDYPVGKYPTSDMVNTQPVISELGEHGCIIELQNGKKVTCYIVQNDPKIILGSFTCDGVNAEIIELSSAKNTYFNKFKNAIENKFDSKFMDVDVARKAFNRYVNHKFV
jgi:hypothetical protein